MTRLTAQTFGGARSDDVVVFSWQQGRGALGDGVFRPLIDTVNEHARPDPFV